jgi:uncharacterized protein (TIGR00725 family)
MFQICVSGAAKGSSVKEGRELAWAVGESIAHAKQALLSGATVGLPNYAAEGYKNAGGASSVGVSPAASKIEHVHKYRLPVKSYDSILYTGLHYVGRDALLINSSDAVISIGGRLGTLHEFTIAMETNKPIAFLQGAGGISTEIMDILRVAGEENSDNVLFGDDPDELMKDLVELLTRRYNGYLDLYT